MHKAAAGDTQEQGILLCREAGLGVSERGPWPGAAAWPRAQGTAEPEGEIPAGLQPLWVTCVEGPGFWLRLLTLRLTGVL